MLAKIAEEKEYYVGSEVNYTIVVDNRSPVNATNVTVTDVLPEGLTLTSTDGNYDPETRTVTWIVNLDANENKTFYVVGVFNSYGVIVNTIIAGNQTGNKTIKVYDVEVIKSANVTNAEVGDIVNYTIFVTNMGVI